MPSDETFWCTNCKWYRRAWEGERADSYGDRRCWECDKWTLSPNTNSRDLVRVQNQVSSLQSENARLDSRNDGLQSLIRAGERELSNKNNQINEKDRQIATYSSQLTTAQNQLTTTRADLVAKNAQYEELMKQFTALQITINNKDNEIEEKANKIKELKGNLSVSQEEFLNQKIEIKDEKLEVLVQQLGISRDHVTGLRNAYERLIVARKDYKQDDMDSAKANISLVKGRILGEGVSVSNTQKVCRKCEKLVKLELELNQVYQEQYQAQQEISPR